jgi:hypothetical protein
MALGVPSSPFSRIAIQRNVQSFLRHGAPPMRIGYDEQYALMGSDASRRLARARLCYALVNRNQLDHVVTSVAVPSSPTLNHAFLNALPGFGPGASSGGTDA